MRIPFSAIAIVALLGATGCSKGDKGDQGAQGPKGDPGPRQTPVCRVRGAIQEPRGPRARPDLRGRWAQ
jgi:hypothetical protein